MNQNNNLNNANSDEEIHAVPFYQLPDDVDPQVFVPNNIQENMDVSPINSVENIAPLDSSAFNLDDVNLNPRHRERIYRDSYRHLNLSGKVAMNSAAINTRLENATNSADMESLETIVRYLRDKLPLEDVNEGDENLMNVGSWTVRAGELEESLRALKVAMNNLKELARTENQNRRRVLNEAFRVIPDGNGE